MFNRTGTARSEGYSGSVSHTHTHTHTHTQPLLNVTFCSVRSPPDMFSFLTSDLRPERPQLDPIALEIAILSAENSGTTKYDHYSTSLSPLSLPLFSASPLVPSPPPPLSLSLSLSISPSLTPLFFPFFPPHPLPLPLSPSVDCLRPQIYQWPCDTAFYKRRTNNLWVCTNPSSTAWGYSVAVTSTLVRWSSSMRALSYALF